MKYFYIFTKNLAWELRFFGLSLLCEIPFYFGIGLLISFIQNTFDKQTDLMMGLIVWFIALLDRVVCLHVFGSWALKRFLLVRNAGAIVIGLCDFILANLWALTWGLIFPQGPAGLLLKGQVLNLQVFKFYSLWYYIFPPIAFGSITFILIFGNAYKRNRRQNFVKS